MNTKNNTITNIFLAIEFDEDIKQLFARKLYLLDFKEFLRLESKKNLHITIGYIQDVHHTERRSIVNAFKGLKDFPVFQAHVEKPIILGEFKHMLCIQHGPYDTFLNLRNMAKNLLTQHTHFAFNEKHPDFLPHTKLQTIRKSAGTEIQDALTYEFMHKNFRKIDFKVKTIALMHRIDTGYETLYRYELKNKNAAPQKKVQHESEPIGIDIL